MTEPDTEQGDQRHRHTLGLAEIQFRGLDTPETIDEAVKRSWVPGQSYETYGRRWRLSRINDENDGYFGRLGYVSDTDLNTVQFDSAVGDFVEDVAPSGVVVPFFISRDGIVTFQLIPNAVREQTFIRVFKGLMVGDMFEWELTPLSYEVDYDAWVKSVRRVTQFSFTLDRPNPHYGDDHIIEGLVEGLSAATITLKGRAAQDEAIDAESDPFRQALDHVLRGYGGAQITGEDSQGSESVWAKLRGSIVARTLARVKSQGTGPLAEPAELRTGRSLLPNTAEAVGLDGDSDNDLAG